jgi:hypothetical protein
VLCSGGDGGLRCADVMVGVCPVMDEGDDGTEIGDNGVWSDKLSALLC